MAFDPRKVGGKWKRTDSGQLFIVRKADIIKDPKTGARSTRLALQEVSDDNEGQQTLFLTQDVIEVSAI